MSDPIEPDLKLRASLRGLPKSVQPERDLWPDIRQQIARQQTQAPSREAGRTGTVRTRWAIAASVAGLAVGVLATLSLQRGGAPVTARTGAPSQTPPVEIVRLGRPIDAGFVPASAEAVRQKLRAQVAAQLANLPPATRNKVEKNLLLIKNAVTDIQSALAQDPGNALLQDLLVTTYQNELDTLANVQALTRSAHPEVST